MTEFSSDPLHTGVTRSYNLGVGEHQDQGGTTKLAFAIGEFWPCGSGRAYMWHKHNVYLPISASPKLVAFVEQVVRKAFKRSPQSDGITLTPASIASKSEVTRRRGRPPTKKRGSILDRANASISVQVSMLSKGDAAFLYLPNITKRVVSRGDKRDAKSSISPLQ